MVLDFDKLRLVNSTRCEKIFHPITEWSPTDWACAFAGEAGEACNKVKKLRRLDTNTYIKKPNMAYLATQNHLIEDIAKEIADTIIYADLLAARLGINLGEAIRKKFNEVSDEMNCDIKL